MEDGTFTLIPAEVVSIVGDVGGFQLQPSNLVPPLVGSSCVSDSGDLSKVEDRPLKLVFLPLDLMDRYLEWAKKMRAEL